MKKITYRNTLAYEYDPNYSGAHYYIPVINKHQNRGQLCEHIAKHNRGIMTAINPPVPFNKGSDIEEEHASIKSAKFSLADNYGDSKTISEALKYYFKNVVSSLFIYVVFNEKTQMVTEYQMNKKEFGRFINYFSWGNIRSNGKIELRGYKDSKYLIEYLESKC